MVRERDERGGATIGSPVAQEGLTNGHQGDSDRPVKKVFTQHSM